MAKKVYAIKEGFDFKENKKIENKIVDTWDECLSYVKGVRGAKYKSFQDIKSAEKYLNEGSKLLKKSEDNYPKNCMHVYVDGSYNIHTERYSYGLVVVKNNVVEYIENGSSKTSSGKNIRQIAGELAAAIRGVQYAHEKGEKKVVVFHDYEGISHHATGFWERRGESSREYYNKMNKLMDSGIEVIFVKVDSHTGDFYNELADEKCKEVLSIPSNKVVEKWLQDNTLTVSSEDVKEEILKLAPTMGNNIILLKGDNIKNKEKVELNKEECKINTFEDIIIEYKKDRKIGKNSIKNLNDEGKINFISYLIEKL